MKEQRVYFVVQYLGNSGLVPILRPVMFLGYLERENPNLRFFQDYDSFIAGVRYDTADASEYEGAFEAYGPDEGKQMFEYEHALHVLMNCALRRRETADVDAEILAQSQERHV
jgi:hypothetical protein